eukprot:CAMPEP_0203885694 /NCGR_PEP_ID=MMETSP0359-20131031/29600_1 /ASSEMBLY_ACC=CAM_ASM_000338 /TAXON_ID=268821 /ORGANISM="Scrippsiella Hangoei, Strain SHTV-5" /LENGTH=49 /DNA_ID=CAMNT_0050806357 /DNA_START=82 /DNA_END=231 /DNA_ORIENTATION=+
MDKSKTNINNNNQLILCGQRQGARRSSASEKIASRCSWPEAIGQGNRQM